MTTDQILQTNAILAIGSVVQRTQKELDAKALEALDQFDAFIRAELAPTEGMSEAEHAVRALLSATVTTSREKDGYPEVFLPQSTKQIVTAALRAGVIADCRFGQIEFYTDLSGTSTTRGRIDEARHAWYTAQEYRKKNAS